MKLKSKLSIFCKTILLLSLALSLVSCEVLTLPFAKDLNNPVDPEVSKKTGTNTGSVPSIPTGLSASAGNMQVVVTWTAVTDATDYKVFYGAGSTASSATTQATAAMISGATATVTELINGTTYAFIVVASNEIGDSLSSAVVTGSPSATALNPSTIIFADTAPSIVMGSGVYTNTVSGVGNGSITYTSGTVTTATVNVSYLCLFQLPHGNGRSWWSR